MGGFKLNLLLRGLRAFCNSGGGLGRVLICWVFFCRGEAKVLYDGPLCFFFSFVECSTPPFFASVAAQVLV